MNIAKFGLKIYTNFIIFMRYILKQKDVIQNLKYLSRHKDYRINGLQATCSELKKIHMITAVYTFQ